jgi:methylated-DNA-[protein]-cysteine S-methyltransferase
MSEQGFSLFETSIGRCGIAWGERGIVGLQLPEASVGAARARMRKRFPAAVESTPPREVARVVRDVTALLGGKRIDLTTVTLDMNGVPPFHRRAYEAARKIPAGKTHSYGELAAKLGSPNSSRAVGQAMGRNPFPIVVPCHRVLAAGGRAGGFTAEGGIDTKMRMLEIEGAQPIVATKRVGTTATTKELAATTRRGGKIATTTDAAKSSRRAAATAPKPRPSKPASAAGLPFDTKKALRELRASDATLAVLMDSVGSLKLQLNTTGSVFGALAEAIVYQQLTGKAAATIYGRICALFPRARGGFTPAHILEASEESLRGAGLSRAKVAALRDLAAKTHSGELPTLAKVKRMDDAAVIESLTGVRGIGRWTVEMLLIFRLARPDVLPVDDYGVRKGYAIAFRKKELPSAKDLALYGEKWKPWRSIASWYLWRATDKKPD